MPEQRYRVDVGVDAHHDPTGRVKPLAVHWVEDGVVKVLPIDRVEDSCLAASLRAGGSGMRYTVRIEGKATYLFDEEGIWFVEAKQPPYQEQE